VLVVAALAWSLPHGLETVALAVFAARAASAVLAQVVAFRRLDLGMQRRGGSIGRALASFVAWAAATSAFALWLAGARPDWAPFATLAAIGAAACGAWIATRLLVDGRALRAEILVFRARFERGRTP
jgi:hypothetical protein